MPQKEQQARTTIDRLLEQAGWYLCDANEANIHSHRGVVVREFPLQSGHGFADYLLYVDGAAAGIIEAKKEGHALSGVEMQVDKYAQGLPAALPAWVRPLPFAYQSTGAETRFTNGLDQQPRALSIFTFHVGATPSRAKPEYWDGGVPWVSSGEVAFCRIQSTRETISAEGLANSSTSLHPMGTVLLGMIGEGKTRGQAAILAIKACNNQNSAAIRVSETDVLPEYFYCFLEKEYEDTRRRGSGGNQPALNKERVRQIPFPLPPIAEQQHIAQEVDRCLSLLHVTSNAIDTALVRARCMRESILGGAFQPPTASQQEIVR